ncbi:calcium/sodium antiporter [Aliiglaciecola sp. LCG003]|uniref:calcium/sodium antiporter n=1 Tax=Aliiglaciecola sp. LCG003 TaxID=3053655 RepID=UPI00257354AC|nr:calcium/sodium antiporter [Aliiglaciecola sp. LCG003]WJG08861.1 calcium/sodium antiporter [Aliiglaciecola sp. LCG003]
MITEVAIFIAGLAVLSWSADRFVFGASALAKNIGVSSMVIGLTIVAMGSSAPEIVVSATASLANNPDTAVGNAIGSNITNVALVLGLTALLKPLIVSSTTVRREMPVLLAVTLLAMYFLSDNYLSFNEGVILIILFFVSIGGLTLISMNVEKDDPLQAETEDEIPIGVPASKAIFWVIIGLILLPVSAHFMVGSAVEIARFFGMSELVIGLTIIALGTSLPELAASIAGVLKGEDDLALGNIIGSNIFNLLAVLAMPGLFAPGFIDENVASRDVYAMLFITSLMIAFSFNLRGTRRINRWEGVALILCYFAYCAFLFY